MEIIKTSFCALMLCLPVSGLSQHNVLDRLSISWEQKRKLDKSIDETKNPETNNTVENEYHTRVQSWLISYYLGKNIILQSGYGKESFVFGYGVQSTSFIIEVIHDYLTCHSVPLRATYTGLGLKYAQLRLSLEPSVGVINNFRKDDGGLGPDGRDILTEPMFSFTNLRRDKQEINLTNYFLLLDSRIQMRLEFAKLFSIYGGIGYSRGFEPIGRINATYTRPPDTTVKALRKTYYGTNTYTNFGLSLNLNGIFKK